MTVPSGRARCGARSLLRALFFGAAAFLGLFASGCGNDTFINGTPVVTISTTPGPFSAYVVEVTLIQLTRNDNRVVYPLVNPQVVDFTKLNDMTELFGAPAILEGTYTSASITLNYGASASNIWYTGALIRTNVNGQPQTATPLDSTGAAAKSVTYTVKFDPAHPLVIKQGISAPIDFNFDVGASSVLNTSTSPFQLTVRPMMTVSTQPIYPKPLRARGVFVTSQSGDGFTMNARAFFDTTSNPIGAIEVQTDANTTYVVNGVSYRGAAGLAAVKALQINTIIEAYGTLGTLNANKPNFVATQVYAGISVENLLTDRITGTVASRTATSLVIHGAEVQIRRFTSGSRIGSQVALQNDIPVTIDNTTIVTVDGQPELQSPSIQNISVGQQVDIEAVIPNPDTPPYTADARNNASNAGLIRMIPTTGWALLNALPQSGTIDANLITLGGFQPAAFSFTGTGAGGADSTAGAYGIATGTLDLTRLTTATSPLFRFDGNVTAFGAAPPAFTAISVTSGPDTDQILTIDWVNGGTTKPFTQLTSTGLVLSVADPNTGTSHTIQTGPMDVQTTSTTVDLATLRAGPTIVPDPSVTAVQFAVGNPTSTTGVSVFHSYASFLTQLNTVLNLTNKIQKLVAVGRYDALSNTFVAYRIDMIQLP